ncbi:MAG: hypothetical protein CM15mP36_14980 [Flavobacteriales bacterium]|nr:MAG: hypothetical protein CM15mP36_14980 [Flavobacteriales bacterium]
MSSERNMARFITEEAPKKKAAEFGENFWGNSDNLTILYKENFLAAQNGNINDITLTLRILKF